jgi:hypothetical protein
VTALSRTLTSTTASHRLLLKTVQCSISTHTSRRMHTTNANEDAALQQHIKELHKYTACDVSQPASVPTLDLPSHPPPHNI